MNSETEPMQGSEGWEGYNSHLLKPSLLLCIMLGFCQSAGGFGQLRMLREPCPGARPAKHHDSWPIYNCRKSVKINTELDLHVGDT